MNIEASDNTDKSLFGAGGLFGKPKPPQASAPIADSGRSNYRIIMLRRKIRGRRT
jgi:hypothetical protein